MDGRWGLRKRWLDLLGTMSIMYTSTYQVARRSGSSEPPHTRSARRCCQFSSLRWTLLLWSSPEPASRIPAVTPVSQGCSLNDLQFLTSLQLWQQSLGCPCSNLTQHHTPFNTIHEWANDPCGQVAVLLPPCAFSPSHLLTNVLTIIKNGSQDEPNKRLRHRHPPPSGGHDKPRRR